MRKIILSAAFLSALSSGALGQSFPGGGGSGGGATNPGGSNGDLQINSSGSFGGLTPGAGVTTALGLTLNGSGALAGTTSPAFVTPSLGAATGTSLALGGATLGSNALAVTGSVAATSFGLGSGPTITTDSGAMVLSGLPGQAGVMLGAAGQNAISSARIAVNYNAVIMRADTPLGWTGGDLGASKDLLIYRDAAGALALQNGTNAQSLRVYNTWSSSGANYESGVFDWQTTANTLTIGATAAGTGFLRGVNIVGASLSINGAAGVSCSAGLPSASFAVTNGIVTHC